MANIKIIFKDGTTKDFLHEGRSGGSYTKHINYIGGFAIIEDEWYRTFAFPQETIKEIQTTPERDF